MNKPLWKRNTLIFNIAVMVKTSQPGVLVSLVNDLAKPIFLLGAGASKQSGVKLVSEIVEEIAKWSYCRDNGIPFDDPRLTMSDWKKWVTKFPWYNDDYSILYPKIVEELLVPRQARKDFFLRIISPDVPASKGYEAMAQLMAMGLLDTVLTTNFDNCLHHASVQIRKPPVLSLIRTPYDLLTLFSYTPKYPQLVYLHGSVEHYTDQNLENEVKSLNPNLVSTLRPLLKDRPVVVIGYRGAEPSIMKDLFIENLDYTNNFYQGIYWCVLKRDFERIDNNPTMTPFLSELSTRTGGNFQMIPIDGFDELLVNEIWGKLRANEIDLRNVIALKPQEDKPPPTYDTKLVAADTIGALEMALLRERIRNYSERLRIKIYEDEDWLYQQMLRLNIAELTPSQKYELTSSGILLFSSQTQKFIPQARVLLRFIGSEEWLKAVTSFPSERDSSTEDLSKGFIERVIEGHLYNQLNEITDALTWVNKPFRLKGETSENVYPYPTLALKEVIVNSLVHRDYSIEEPVVIEVKQAQISFISPGGLVEEVRRQLATKNIEDEIRKGKRGIKGYRNPVLADLFYGSGAMDKEGSGLSDVLQQVSKNSGNIKFGPVDEEKYFEVIIYRRFEEVDEITQTATPLILNESSKLACNLFEVLQIPEYVYYADTTAKRYADISQQLGKVWHPPFLLHREKMWSFYDLSEWQNPLRKCVDLGTAESMPTSDFIEQNGGTNEFVRMLNDCLIGHLFSIGLRVDTRKKRAYFMKTHDGGAKEIRYQARLKKATRTVAKPRVNLATGKVYYWEHKSIWFRFEKIGESWYLIINPSYVFTTDGAKFLLKSERVNVLSTKKASRDYNLNIHNDLSFWANYISLSQEAGFVLRPNSREINEGTKLGPIMPNIILTTKLPSITINDISIGEEFMEPIGLEDFEDIEKELEELAEQEQRDID